MTLRPSFQFYPADWRGNAKLRRCSDAARGAWMDILCVLHDQDEYGVCRWPLVDLARSAGVRLSLARELADKGVLKGADDGPISYSFTPRHAGREGQTVELVRAESGPCWFSSRLVRDEWIRQRRGSGTQFTAENQPPKPQPKLPFGVGLGDGPISSSSSVSTKKKESPNGDLGGSPKKQPPILAAVEAYNAAAETAGWPKSQRLLNGRQQALIARLGEVGIEVWTDAMQRAARSDFLTGAAGRTDGHENWTPDLGWFVKAENFTKVIEGRYDNRHRVQRSSIINPFSKDAKS